ncbi:hypothetical protein Tsubulata_004606 [Turnera subulata]|uniref:Uncharacterized protein n=1 Tax=Turnera subulata TaxID=218843 RepID=A0A9Q0GAV8_9ROSI|nr:hypothetical protein Tsubulata_004606 [Turnera subulata]
MHQKKQEKLIRKQGRGRGRGIYSSGLNPSLPFSNPSRNQPQPSQILPNSNQQTQPQTQRHQLQIQINPPTLVTHQPLHELPISSIQSTTTTTTPQRTILSIPHKRPTMMAPSLSPPYPLSHSSTLSSPPNQANSDPNPRLGSAASSTTFKTLACRLFVHISHARLLCVQLRVLIFISFPTFYLLVSNSRRFYLINLLFLLAFSVTVLVSLNLVFPRLPYIRFLLARSLPIKFKSTQLPTKATKPVVWSIGSKLQVEKKPYSGSCVQVYSNGDVYEGEFHKGKCSGSGVYYYYMSGRYEGDWIDGKYDGYGVEAWARGSRYRGQYRQGLRHGIGVYRFYTGDVYAGEWYNGQCHGCGIHTCEDGSKYVGEFKWGVKHGLGHYHFRNGDTYAGEYFADKMHGFGVYQFGNGHRYEGAWHEGRRQGFGVYTFRNGERQSGHWQNGVLSTENSSPRSPFAATHSKVVFGAENSCPGSPCASSESKILNAVQEAQRAAERAYNVAQIDERVNKTVAAANKAANAARVAAVKAVQKQMHDNQIEDLPAPSFSR